MKSGRILKAWRACSIRACAALLLVVGAASVPASAQTNSDACVMSAATTGVVDFVARIPEPSLSDYGFASRAAANNTALGTPFRLYSILPPALSGYVDGNTVESLLSETAYWYFPLLVAGEMRAFLIVEVAAPGSCRAVSIGRALLAQQLRGVGVSNGSLGASRRLVVVYQANEFLLADLTQSPGALVSLRPAGGAASLQAPDLGQVVQRLRPVVEENLRGGARP